MYCVDSFTVENDQESQPHSRDHEAYLDTEEGKDFLASIKATGGNQVPAKVFVREGIPFVVCGRHRWAACRSLKLPLSVIVVPEAKLSERIETQVHSNLQRRISSLARCEAIVAWREARKAETGKLPTKGEAGKAFGWSAAQVSQALVFVDLPESGRTALDKGRITLDRAKAIIDSCVDVAKKARVKILGEKGENGLDEAEKAAHKAREDKCREMLKHSPAPQKRGRKKGGSPAPAPKGGSPAPAPAPAPARDVTPKFFGTSGPGEGGSMEVRISSMLSMKAESTRNSAFTATALALVEATGMDQSSLEREGAMHLACSLSLDEQGKFIDDLTRRFNVAKSKESVNKKAGRVAS